MHRRTYLRTSLGVLFFSGCSIGLGHAGSVVLDGSYGTSGALTGPNYIITAGMGREVGNNLFQSFGLFDLTNGDTATFSGPANIQNILARVTGGSMSSIDGTIDCSIAGASLFLINPAGVMFGPHAQVNVTGSFAVSTANYVKFNDGGIFYAQLGANDSLSSAPVSAFGFLTATPQPVSFAGTQITMQPGAGLDVVAGNITLDQGSADGVTEQGTKLHAPSGSLTLFSAASAGEVPFSLASPGSGYATAPFTAFGNITMQNNSAASISGSGGGHMVIRGGKIVVDNSLLTSNNSGSVAGGDISVQADSLTVQDAGEVVATTIGSGDAGNVSVTANSATIDGTLAPANEGNANPTGIFSNSNPGATGNAGSVDVTVANGLSILNNGLITGDTFSAGTGGDVTLQSASLTISGSSTATVFTGVSSNANAGSTGNAGDVNVTTTGNVDIGGGGLIGSGTFGSGNAGDVTVQAGSMNIDGMNFSLFTGIESQANPGATGNSGKVNVTVNNDLSVSNNGDISSGTFGPGSAGNVTLQAGSLTITASSGSFFLTGINSQANSGSTGNAGVVNVTVAGNVTLSGGAEIASSSYGTGNAGGVTIQADSLDLDGSPTTNYLTAILSESDSSDPTSTGTSGSVTVNVTNLLSLTGGGDIDADSATAGNAGIVYVHAGSLTIDGTGAPNGYTGISSDTVSNDVTSPAKGGSVTVDVDGLLSMTGIISANYTSSATIESNSYTNGNAGDVSVHAGSLSMDGAYITTESDGVDASPGTSGKVTVTVGGLLNMTDGSSIDSDTYTSGNAGNVTVHAGSMLSDGSFISSESAGDDQETSSSGKVTITVDGLCTITDYSSIDTDTYTCGNAGDMIVNAGSLSLTGGSFISSDALNLNDNNATNNTGNAGKVAVSVNNALDITSGGQIDGTTNTEGLGGKVTVNAGSIAINANGDPSFTTGITAQATGTGNGGDLIVKAGTVSLAGGGTISTSSAMSNAGNINISAGNFSLLSGSTVDTSAGINGGSITLSVGGLVYLLDSEISATAGGNGGNILIDPQLVVLDDSLINASAGGQGGNITIITSDYLQDESQLIATGTTAGTIVISSPEVNLSGSLLALPGELVSEENRLREKCARALNNKFSSFIVVGRGGTESAPEELQPDFGLDLPTRD